MLGILAVIVRRFLNPPPILTSRLPCYHMKMGIEIINGSVFIGSRHWVLNLPSRCQTIRFRRIYTDSQSIRLDNSTELYLLSCSCGVGILKTQWRLLQA